jgi:hypothetical protein
MEPGGEGETKDETDEFSLVAETDAAAVPSSSSARVSLLPFHSYPTIAPSTRLS